MKMPKRRKKMRRKRLTIKRMKVLLITIRIKITMTTTKERIVISKRSKRMSDIYLNFNILS
jgi:hypothetical protein